MLVVEPEAQEADREVQVLTRLSIRIGAPACSL